MRREFKKGYVDYKTCEDGENHHDWDMKEHSDMGIVIYCKTCGYWC